jgi:hypothetical protein
MRRYPYTLLFLACLVGLLAGCSNEQRLARGKPLRNLNPNQVLEAFEANQIPWEWLGMKIDASVETASGVDSFKASIRMAKDSAIWVSLSPALGVEVARLLLEPDSVRLISKIPGNRFHFAGDYAALSAWADTPLSFRDIQDILTGRPMGIDPEFDKFNCRIDGYSYALIGKYKRRIKRLVSVDNNALEPQDSLGIQATDRRYERVRNRTEDSDLLVKRHWFDGLTFDPLQDRFDDLYYQRSLTIERKDFSDRDEGRWPNEIRLAVTTPEGNLNMEWELMRIRFGRAYDFPFEIPDNYERRTGF